MDMFPQPPSGVSCSSVLKIARPPAGLLAVIVLALFSPVLSECQAASGNPPTLDPFAQSALNIILGDLTQEIVRGSTATTAGTASIYTPSSPANAVPMRSGANLIPALIRCSVRDDTIPPPALGSMASAVNSASDAALNGLTISPSIWNSHYLIPRASSLNAATDTTPVSSFTAPDWVMVTRSGPAVETAVGSGSTALNNPAVSNSNYVVGRYAFAIYDESALLDANVA